MFVLLLRIVALAQNARRDQTSRYATLFLAGVAAFVVGSAPGFGTLAIGWRLPIQVVNSTTEAAFWITMGAFFDDEFRPRWYHAIAWLALAAFEAVQSFIYSIVINAAHSALALMCVLLGIWHALAGRATDLVEGRRRVRAAYAVAAGLYTGLVVATDWLWPGSLSVAPLSLANAAGLMLLIFLSAVFGPLPAFGQPLAPAGARATPTQSLPIARSPTEPDAALLSALRNLIDHDKVYREPDLSVASLSQKLDIPQHRLRQLINRQLGHRNFSTFVNGYRLAEAEAALGDPAQASVPVLTIALDAGFGSIGPFNRAFKAQTGLTPTEYRRTRLEAIPADQPLEPLPIPKIG